MSFLLFDGGKKGNGEHAVHGRGNNSTAINVSRSLLLAAVGPGVERHSQTNVRCVLRSK